MKKLISILIVALPFSLLAQTTPIVMQFRGPDPAVNGTDKIQYNYTGKAGGPSLLYNGQYIDATFQTLANLETTITNSLTLYTSGSAVMNYVAAHSYVLDTTHTSTGVATWTYIQRFLTQANAAAAYQTLSNLSTSTSLGTSNTLYPSQNAVKTYVDTHSATYSNGYGLLLTGTIFSADTSALQTIANFKPLGSTYWLLKTATVLPSSFTASSLTSAAGGTFGSNAFTSTPYVPISDTPMYARNVNVVHLSGNETITEATKTFRYNNIGTTLTPAIIVANNASASSGTTIQRSPSEELTGAYWNGSTSVSATVDNYLSFLNSRPGSTPAAVTVNWDYAGVSIMSVAISAASPSSAAGNLTVHSISTTGILLNGGNFVYATAPAGTPGTDFLASVSTGGLVGKIDPTYYLSSSVAASTYLCVTCTAANSIKFAGRSFATPLSLPTVKYVAVSDSVNVLTGTETIATVPAAYAFNGMLAAVTGGIDFKTNGLSTNSGYYVYDNPITVDKSLTVGNNAIQFSSVVTGNSGFFSENGIALSMGSSSFVISPGDGVTVGPTYALYDAVKAYNVAYGSNNIIFQGNGGGVPDTLAFPTAATSGRLYKLGEGFANPMTAQGDFMVQGASGPDRLAGNTTISRPEFLVSNDVSGIATPSLLDLFNTGNGWLATQIMHGLTIIGTPTIASVGGNTVTLDASRANTSTTYLPRDGGGIPGMLGNYHQKDYTVVDNAVGTIISVTAQADGIYRIEGYFNVTASGGSQTEQVLLQYTYTDLQGTTQTVQGQPYITPQSISFDPSQNSAGLYLANNFLAKAGTTITVQTVGSNTIGGDSITLDIGAVVLGYNY